MRTTLRQIGDGNNAERTRNDELHGVWEPYTVARVCSMVKYQCHAAGGHQTKSSIGSKAEKLVIEVQSVEKSVGSS